MKGLFSVGIVLALFVPGIRVIAQGNTDTIQHEKRHSFAISGGYGKAKPKIQRADSNKRFSIGFNYGYGVPVGSFREADQGEYPISRLNKGDTNRLGGYAQSGFHYEFFGACKIFRYISIMLSLSGNDIGYNINTVNDQYIQYFAPNTVAITSGDNYYILQYQAGPNINLPIGKYFSIEIKALAGVTSTNYPTLSYIGQGKDSLFSFPKGYGFGYNVGAGIKFITADGYVGVHLNIDYAGSTINFPSYSAAFFTPQTSNPATSNIYLGSAIYNTPKTLEMNLVQVTMGVTLEL